MKDNRSEALLICRFCMSLLFLVDGWDKLVNPEVFATSLVHNGIPWPALMTYLGVMIELCGGLAVLLGLWTQVAASIFVVYIFMATAIAHRFWAMPEPAATINLIEFNKNLVMMGGFVLLAMIGPGRFAIDTLMTKRPVLRLS